MEDITAYAADDSQTVTLRDGTVKVVTFHVFPALLGFDIEQGYQTQYVEQSDRHTRRAFIASILAHAELDGQRLGSEEAINTLGSWRNVEAVFNGVLAYNGIALEPRPEPWLSMPGGSVLAAALLTRVWGVAAEELNNG